MFSFGAAQAADGFFVPADVRRDGFERYAELVDLDGEAGEAVRVTGPCTVFFDYGA